MSNFVDAAQESNAIEFQQELQTAIGEKVGIALEAKKAEVAQGLIERATIEVK